MRHELGRYRREKFSSLQQKLSRWKTFLFSTAKVMAGGRRNSPASSTMPEEKFSVTLSGTRKFSLGHTFSASLVMAVLVLPLLLALVQGLVRLPQLFFIIEVFSLCQADACAAGEGG